MSAFTRLINKQKKKIKTIKKEIKDNLKSVTPIGRERELDRKIKRNREIKRLELSIGRLNVAQTKIEKKSISDAEKSVLIKDMRNILKDFL